MSIFIGALIVIGILILIATKKGNQNRYSGGRKRRDSATDVFLAGSIESGQDEKELHKHHPSGDNNHHHHHHDHQTGNNHHHNHDNGSHHHGHHSSGFSDGGGGHHGGGGFDGGGGGHSGH